MYCTHIHAKKCTQFGSKGVILSILSCIIPVNACSCITQCLIIFQEVEDQIAGAVDLQRRLNFQGGKTLMTSFNTCVFGSTTQLKAIKSVLENEGGESDEGFVFTKGTPKKGVYTSTILQTHILAILHPIVFT